MPTDEQRITPDVLRDMARAAGYKPEPANPRYEGWTKPHHREGDRHIIVPTDEAAPDYQAMLWTTHRQLSRDPEYLMNKIRSRDAEVQALRKALGRIERLYDSPDPDDAAVLREAMDIARAALAGGETGETE